MQKMLLGEIKKLSSLLATIEQDAALQQTVVAVAQTCVAALQQGKKILFAGNGGSAADSQHLAAELITRLQFDRPGLAAMALTTDTSTLTAISNDYSYERIFARQIECVGQAGDIFFAISTSGKSPNILRALEAARHKHMVTVGLTGMQAPQMALLCDWIINIPSTETPKIQECHIMFGHIICSLIESAIFGAEYDHRQVLSVASA